MTNQSPKWSVPVSILDEIIDDLKEKNLRLMRGDDWDNGYESGILGAIEVVEDYKKEIGA